MSNKNNTQKVISSFYFLDNDLQLQKIVTSKNVISAIHEQELNGLIRADIELDLSYSKFLVAGIDYVGYHYKDNFYLHKIQRVEHDHVDEITKVVLRHIFFEDMLYGKIIKDIRPVNREAGYVLRNTIDTHSRWRTVMTDVTGSLSTNFYWQVMYEVIEFVTENYRIEYLPVLKFDGQKVTSFELHAANRIGEDKNIRIPFGSRVLELKYDVDYSEIVTRLVGHGKGEEVGDGYGRRIDFKDINFNKNGVVSPIGDVYMEDESVTAQYGNDGQTPREGRIVFEDIEDPNELANETYNHYLKVSRPQMLFTADVADIGDVGIGDSVLIIRREHDVYFKARIHKLTVDLLNPSDAQVELGDYEHFKYSKVEKARVKSDKEFKKETNNRIENLKRQFDTEFDSQVEEFKKEFEQKLIDVSAQIQADKEAFELRYKADKEALSNEIQDSYTNAVTEANSIVEAKETDFKNYADGIGNAANGRIDELYEGFGDLSSEFENLEIGGRNYFSLSQAKRTNGIVTIPVEPNTDYIVSSNVPFSTNGTTLYYDGLTTNTDGVWNGNPVVKNSGDKETMYVRIYPNRPYTSELMSGDYYIMWEKGNKATDHSLAPEELMKYTDIVARPDGFLIGSFEMGGDKIAQAIVGKSGAIDLIAQNVNFTGNVNVANQIKAYSLEAVYADIAKLRTNILTANSVEATALKVDTALINKLNTNSILTNYLIADTAMINNIKAKSLEAVYADISELRTRLLVADVITANMVKFDTALIEKFTSSTAFINSFFAKSATISNVKAIDIDFNRATATGLNGSNTLLITADRIEQRGRFNRTYFGVSNDYDVTTTLRGGYLRFWDNTRQVALNMSAFGISTYLDGDGGGEGSSGAIQWWDKTYSPSGANGITMSSYGGVAAVKSGNNRVVLEANTTVMLESKTAPIDFHTHTSGPYNTLFRMTKSSNNQNGYLVYGASSGLIGLRFMGTSHGRLAIVDSNFETGGTTSLEAGKVIVNEVESRVTGRFAYWNGTSTGTIDDVINVSSTQLLASSMVTIKGDKDMFLGTRSGGILRVTDEKGYNAGKGITYRDIHFQNWKAWSSESAKTEIEKWDLDVLQIIKDELQLYKYKFKHSIGSEFSKINHGIILRNDSNKDEFPVEWRDGDGFDGNEVMWWNTKAIQELAYENDTLKDRINDLENKINKIMEMMA